MNTMTTEPKSELADRLNRQFDQMVNDQFSTPELQQYYSIPLTWKRALFREQQRMPYILNRRTCWAYVQARAPLDVKQVIWKHEQEELIFDERANSDHFSLAQRQARDLGVAEEELAHSEPPPMVRAALYAHIHLVTTFPWLGALAACHILERRNNSRVVKGGGATERWRRKLIDELGISNDRLPDSNVHVVADVDHADFVWNSIAHYIVDQQAFDTAMEGAKESLLIDRAVSGAWWYYMQMLKD
jgi:Iron-containing redox enzyme